MKEFNIIEMKCEIIDLVQSEMWDIDDDGQVVVYSGIFLQQGKGYYDEPSHIKTKVAKKFFRIKCSAEKSFVKYYGPYFTLEKAVEVMGSYVKNIDTRYWLSSSDTHVEFMVPGWDEKVVLWKIEELDEGCW